jgi:AcrR family transcriptional regulator
MLDETKPRDRIVAAALRLAERKGWHEVSLGGIAAEAGMPLVVLRHEFQSKGQILAAFSRAVDHAVLERFPAPTDDAPRDRLFDVLITRFEIMRPYKGALRRIRDDLRCSFAEAAQQMRTAQKSIYWMLAAAGIPGEGGAGLLRVQGLLALYARVFAIWLDDDDPGMARTMAELDRRLRRGEAAIRRIGGIRERLRRLTRGSGGEPETKRDAEEAETPGAAI